MGLICIKMFFVFFRFFAFFFLLTFLSLFPSILVSPIGIILVIQPEKISPSCTFLVWPAIIIFAAYADPPTC